MTNEPPSVQDVDKCVKVLAEDFPVEDIWVLEAARAHECGLDDTLQLIAFVAEGNEAHVIEERASRSLRERFGDLGVHVFPHAAMFQTPRPLLVKMAFTSGHQVFSR